LVTANPYAPLRAGTNDGGSEIGAYEYDTAGNRLSKKAGNLNQTIQMGLVTKPTLIQQGTLIEAFSYDPNTRRYLHTHADNRKTFYLNNGEFEYRLPPSGDTSTATAVVYIRAKGYSADVQVEQSANTRSNILLFLKDHLGSPICSVDKDGNIERRQRFAAWGQVTNADGTEKDPSLDSEKSEKFRGFTGHETIGSVNLVHMNGRVYDPEIALFLGPDRFIQGRSISDVNRFNYGNNSASNVIDPSGWMILPGNFFDSSYTRETLSGIYKSSPRRITPYSASRAEINALSVTLDVHPNLVKRSYHKLPVRFGKYDTHYPFQELDRLARNTRGSSFTSIRENTLTSVPEDEAIHNLFESVRSNPNLNLETSSHVGHDTSIKSSLQVARDADGLPTSVTLKLNVNGHLPNILEDATTTIKYRNLFQQVDELANNSQLMRKRNDSVIHALGTKQGTEGLEDFQMLIMEQDLHEFERQLIRLDLTMKSLRR